MSMNKFGKSLNGASNAERAISLIRGYVRNSALCLNPDQYDAKKRRIVRVAAPLFDTDVTNKGYIDDAFVDRDGWLSKVQDDLDEVREQLDTSVDAMVTKEIFDSAIANVQDTTNKRIVTSVTTLTEKIEKTIELLRNDIERLSRTSQDTLADLNKRICNESSHVTRKMLKQELDRTYEKTIAEILKGEQHLKRTLTRELNKPQTDQ